MSKYAKDVLLVIDEIDAINLMKFGVESEACKIIPYNSEFLDREDPVIKKLADERLLSAPQVLMRSPYSAKKYYMLEDFNEKKQLEYFDRFTNICSLLGVSCVNIEKICKIQHDKDTRAGGDVESPAIKVKTEVEITDGNFRESCFRIVGKMSPKKDIDTAKKLIEKYELEDDKDIKALVDAINCGSEFNERRIHLNISSNILKICNIVADVSAKLKGVECKLKSKFEKTSNIQETYSLTVCLKFGDM